MKKNLFLAALAIVALASCTDSEFVGDNGPDNNSTANEKAIVFGLNLQNNTRAGELTGATAAEKLGGMFVVEGTKGSEQTNSPSTTVVFDNYLVGYTANTAATTESNTNNWEYVGLQNGITTPLRMSAETWTALHPNGTGVAQAQTIKYWDYSTSQYDFYAWSTGTCEAIPVPTEAVAPADGKIQVSRINQVTTAAQTGFTMRASSVNDLKQCYYTDINTVLKANYNKPVTLTFRNMTAKVRIALYETVPGYSVKDVQFYQAEAADPTAPDDLAANISSNPATLFTTGSNKLPQSGIVTVLYPRVGTNNSSAADHNKASVTVTSDAGTEVTKQEFGTLAAQYSGKEAHEATGNIYLGRTLTAATFAGSAANSYYQDVIPNTNPVPLTLRVNYKLVSTDGSGEEITIHGAKAVVPATYTKWLPNYAYTYIFKISDNTNGYTSTASGDPKGLFPVTFDAIVASFVDANAEQTTVTTVATPSITTYQQGHNTGTSGAYTVPDEYDNDGAKLYVQVMDNSNTEPALVATLTNTNSLLFKITKSASDYVASEAEVMDALENRTNAPTGDDPEKSYKDASPVGRNGITLIKNNNINNAATQIVNGVDNQPIDVGAGKVAEINIANLTAGTYAYVYCTTVPTSEEKVYNVVSISTDEAAAKYYEIAPGSIVAETSADDKAEAGKVYFIENLDAEGHSLSPKSYTFKQTKVGESVAGLFEATISAKGSTYTAGNFYFDVYYQNNGAYAVKVFKVVD